MRHPPFYKRSMVLAFYFLQLLILVPSIQSFDFLPELTPRIQASSLSPAATSESIGVEASTIELNGYDTAEKISEAPVSAEVSAATEDSAATVSEIASPEASSEAEIVTEASSILPADEVEASDTKIDSHSLPTSFAEPETLTEPKNENAATTLAASSIPAADATDDSQPQAASANTAVRTVTSAVEPAQTVAPLAATVAAAQITADNASATTGVNVALDKPVTTSQEFKDLAYINDGNKLNKVAYADGAPNTGLQWVQIDLQQQYDINGIRLWHYYDTERQYQDVIVQLSNDAAFTKGVTTVFNNDQNNTAGKGIGTDSEYAESIDGKLITVNAVIAQFARFYANGNNVNPYSHYVEIQVFGHPATNLALGKAVSSSQPISDSRYITDGNARDATAFTDSTPNAGLQWVQVDLQKAYDIEQIKLWHYYGDSRQYRDVIVQLSNDAAFAKGVTTVFNNDRDNSAGKGRGTDLEYAETSAGKIIPVDSVIAQFVRFYANGSNVNDYSHYAEIQVFGNPDTSSGTFVKMPTPYWDGTTWKGSTNQAVHPSVLQFDQAWNGYKYWMAYTPYPYADDWKENPSIVASHDGFLWEVPTGVRNPIVDWTGNTVAYNSDTSLLYRADTKEMEMWYRQVQWYLDTDNQVEVIYRVKTTNGVNWTAPEQMIYSNDYNILQYISPSVIYENSVYKMLAMRDYQVFYTQSSNGKTWTTAVPVRTNGLDFNTWHPSVVKLSNQYHMLNYDTQGRIQYSLSTDGLNYSAEKVLLEPVYGVNLYRATMTTGKLGYYVYYGNVTATNQYTFLMAYGSTMDQIGVNTRTNTYQATMLKASTLALATESMAAAGDNDVTASPAVMVYADDSNISRSFDGSETSQAPATTQVMFVFVQPAAEDTAPSGQVQLAGTQLAMTDTTAIPSASTGGRSIMPSEAAEPDQVVVAQPGTDTGADVGAAMAKAESGVDPRLSRASLGALGALVTLAVGSMYAAGKKRQK